MPELPEMETYRRHLTRYALGRTVVKAEVERARSLNVGVREFKAGVVGQTLTGFERAGKHLILRLSNRMALLNHLMLGGAIFYGRPEEAPRNVYQVILHLDNDNALHWAGLRLGWLHLLDQAALHVKLRPLGVDPFADAFTPDYVAKQLSGRRVGLKAVLVDQKRFPGIGNCYADESCWAAQIHPLRPARSLHVDETERLWASIRQTLARAVQLGGYTETPFTAGDMLSGGYNAHLAVYDRPGEPCRRCGTAIDFREASGRKVFHCPSCQPAAAPDPAFLPSMGQTVSITPEL